MSVADDDDELQLLDPRQDALVVAPVQVPVRPARGWWLTLGWSATSAPVALLLVVGIGLGPRGINLLTASALSLMSPVIPVALGALGVLVGLGLGQQRPHARRVLAGAFFESGVTAVIVSIGLIAVLVLFRDAIGRVFDRIVEVLDGAPEGGYEPGS